MKPMRRALLQLTIMRNLSAIDVNSYTLKNTAAVMVEARPAGPVKALRFGTTNVTISATRNRTTTSS